MSSCPYCNVAFECYTVVGVMPANEHLTDWLDPVPVAQLVCQSCGRYTFMHPDHPDVQRLHKGPCYERAENVRTLNVPLEEVGDEELREQFAHGEDHSPPL